MFIVLINNFFQLYHPQTIQGRINNFRIQFMSTWVGVRHSILTAVFLANLMNFSTQWLARKADDEEIANRTRNSHSSVFLFGLVSLFACNLVQAGIFEAIISWIVLGSLVFMHYLNFKSVNERMRSFSRLLFTALLFCQCVGTVIQYIA